jgi:hypothetical protein
MCRRRRTPSGEQGPVVVCLVEDADAADVPRILALRLEVEAAEA